MCLSLYLGRSLLMSGSLTHRDLRFCSAVEEKSRSRTDAVLVGTCVIYPHLSSVVEMFGLTIGIVGLRVMTAEELQKRQVCCA
eukprot:COSAG01_NODE_12012_length_1816_cov_13.527082_3_plen_83_part_00